DFDDDGVIDVLVFNNSTGNVNSFLKGNGDGTFQAPLARNQIQNAAQIAYYRTGPDFDALWLSAGAINVNNCNLSGYFYAPHSFGFACTSRQFAIGDFDADGYPDVVVSTDTGLRVLMNNRFANGYAGFGPASTATSESFFALRVADVN